MPCALIWPAYLTSHVAGTEGTQVSNAEKLSSFRCSTLCPQLVCGGTPHLYCLTSSATLVFTTGPCMGQMPAATKPTPTAADPMLCSTSQMSC